MGVKPKHLLSTMSHYSSLIAAAWSQGRSSSLVRPLVDTFKYIRLNNLASLRLVGMTDPSSHGTVYCVATGWQHKYKFELLSYLAVYSECIE